MQTIHASPFAGRWYPEDKTELRNVIEESLRASTQRTCEYVRPGGIAFVVPHAAPVYSGTVAAAAYRHVAVSKPRRVILLGFSHRQRVNGIAVPDIAAISTPLGITEIDTAAIRELRNLRPFHVTDGDTPRDHSVEIQLPFLETVAPDARVLPLYVGHLDAEQREAAARVLLRLINQSTVLIASSDLTHYGPDFGYTPFTPDQHTRERLSQLDQDVMQAAGSLDEGTFFDELQRTGSTVCGSEPIALLLATLRRVSGEDIFQEDLDYQTSGEISDDYEHSVSYGALGYFPYDSFLLSEESRTALLDSARRTLEHWQATGERRRFPANGPAELRQRRSIFVTVYQAGELQGCIGRCHAPEPLAESAARLTLSAALDDDRFNPLRVDEPVAIEISVLSPFKRLSSVDGLRAGEDGGLLEWDGKAGLLLPKVASERGWNRSQFLDALAQKAGLPKSICKDPQAHLSVFRAQVFGEA